MTEDMIKTSMDIPTSLWDAVKVEAVRRKCTARDIVVAGLKKELSLA